jgi:dihydroorotate dehydrogenase electron transfer subunit
MNPDAIAASPAGQWLAPVVENLAIAHKTYRLRLDAPDLAAAIRPGQFVMLRPGAKGSDDPLLGRPFALYEVVDDGQGTPWAVDLVYLVVGRGTGALSERRTGERISVWGPLGNGFGAPPAGPAIFVAGGIGQTPFLALGRWWLGQRTYGSDHRPWDLPCPRAILLYGVRTASLLAGVSDFERAGMTVEVATDDGTAGHHGLVTHLLAGRLQGADRPAELVVCGPPPMLAAVARLARQAGIRCLVSLENHMACGFGACFSCVVPVLQADGGSDLRRVCVEGPVFDAAAVDWSAVGCH